MNQGNIPPYYQQQQVQPGMMNNNMNMMMNPSGNFMSSQPVPPPPQQAPVAVTSNPNQLAAANGLTKSIDIDFSSATLNNEINEQIAQILQNEFATDDVPDPVTRCKELFPIFKTYLQNLLTQLSVILNPTNEINKSISENQLASFGKNVENFNKICDFLNVSLRAGCESQMMANDLRVFYRYYAHMDNQDTMRTDALMLNSMNIQTQRVNELKSLFNKFLE